jgi:cob(I)alamin adenosyltransferase
VFHYEFCWHKTLYGAYTPKSLRTALLSGEYKYMVAQIDRFGDSSSRSISSKPNSSQVIGEALKIAATGRRVLVVQFLKGGLHQGAGNMVNLAQNLDWIRSDVSRQLASGSLTAEETKSLQGLWQHVQGLVRSVEYQLVILEDIAAAIELGAIDSRELDRLLANRPASVEIEIPGDRLELQAS